MKRTEQFEDSHKSQETIAFPRTLDENLEFYRKRLIRTDKIEERVVSRFYGFETNRCKPMLVEKITMDRLIKKHGNNGYICIGAYHSNLDQETNDKNTKRLIRDIRKRNYRYLPVYGEVESKFEPSFIVFNYNRAGEVQNWGDMKNFGIEMCGKYDQSSVLMKSPDNPPIWLDRNGNRRSKDEQEFFASLVSLERVDTLKTQYLWQEYVRKCKENGLEEIDRHKFEAYKKEHWKDAPVYRRITNPIEEEEIVEGIYVNPSPCDRNERIGRHYLGEILIMLELFEE